MASKAGRKSKYDSELLKVAIKYMAEKGLTDKEMSDELGISRSTLSKWKADNPDFAIELKDWKLEADKKVERSLYERACGYSHAETKPQWVQDVSGGRWEYADLIKHYPPDSTSMIFWLKNRQPDNWRDKTEHDINLKSVDDIVKEIEDETSD